MVVDFTVEDIRRDFGEFMTNMRKAEALRQEEMGVPSNEEAANFTLNVSEQISMSARIVGGTVVNDPEYLKEAIENGLTFQRALSLGMIQSIVGDEETMNEVMEALMNGDVDAAVTAFERTKDAETPHEESPKKPATPSYGYTPDIFSA